MYWYQFCTGFNSKLFLDHFSATEMHIEQGSSIVYRSSVVFQWKCRLSAASRSQPDRFHEAQWIQSSSLHHPHILTVEPLHDAILTPQTQSVPVASHVLVWNRCLLCDLIPSQTFNQKLNIENDKIIICCFILLYLLVYLCRSRDTPANKQSITSVGVFCTGAGDKTAACNCAKCLKHKTDKWRQSYHVVTVTDMHRVRAYFMWWRRYDCHVNASTCILRVHLKLLVYRRNLCQLFCWFFVHFS